MNRLAIYFYFDKNGWVGDYAIHYLKKLKGYCNEICVVVNKPITDDGYRKFNDVADVVLLRNNIGFDSWAYKHALEHYGYEKLKEYDELILNNFTCYGPIYPLREIFSEMESRDCDFWGINRHPKLPLYVSSDPNSLVCEHIQSYFIVFRKKILESPDFRQYWNTLQPVNSYEEAITRHELRCTPWFEQRGYRSSVYMDFTFYNQYKDNASVLLADMQHIQHRNPLVKRKVFFLEKSEWLDKRVTRTARDVLNHIQKNTNYDVELIWQDLLKTQTMSLLRDCLHLNYYLPSNVKIGRIAPTKIALILFVYYDSEVDLCLRYINSLPENTNIYIISAKKELLDIYRKKTGDMTLYHFDFRHMPENRGRDIAAYLVTAADVYAEHDLICCMHDKCSGHVGNGIPGIDFAYHCFENNLATKSYVHNIVHTFQNNPRLGLLVPPVIDFSEWYPTLGRELGGNKSQVKEIYELLSLSIPFDDAPVAPFGTMFWVRGCAFEPLFRYNWRYSDFPKEPLPTDHTILHAVERIYPMVVQEAGYYTAWCATIDYTSVYSDNHIYMLREYNRLFTSIFGGRSFRDQYRLLKRTIKSKKRFYRYKFYIHNFLKVVTWGRCRIRNKERADYYWKAYNSNL